ncbi:MAG: hypothetical protein IJI68_07905 [Eggerthellaceae bacterium]|nr:hypothetical protein [Eggerthellaceae bacterium]
MIRGKQGEGNRKGNRSPLKVLAAILTIIVVIMFISVSVRVNDYSKGYVVDYGVRDYIYSAEDGRFGNLYATAIRDMSRNAEYTAEVEECRALAFYYEQAVLEHAYREAGDNAKADEFAARMAEYESQLGSLRGKVDAVKKAVSS